MKPGAPYTLVDALLAEQQTLTAVGKFSQAHDRGQTPLLEPHYRDLIPLQAPRPGEQYAFEVDLDRCSGCKGCVTACHSLNGLDDGEAWREVGTLQGEALVPDLHGGNRVVPLRQTVTTACHHCVEPACLLGCPVLAYDKDPVTGIVRHLDDQCIGCSYCVMQCPYEVPKYSARRGIVRKCDLCHDRLAAGEAPACVQACPNEAIRITVVQTAAVRDKYRARNHGRAHAQLSTPGRQTFDLCPKEEGSGAGPQLAPGTLPLGAPRAEPAPQFRPFAVAPRAPSDPATERNSFLPDAPEPALTLPTTRYVSSRTGAPLLAADHFNLRPAPTHWPLVWMLVLTQAGIGGWFATLLSGPTDADRALRSAAVSFGLFLAGLAASVFHLGRPAKAWRIWLGWRTSWLSREAIVLNLFAATFAIALATRGLMPGARSANPILTGLVVLGLLAIFAQAMVYADTRRRFWRLAATLPRFLGTAAILGLGLKLCVQPEDATAFSLIGVCLGKLALEVAVLKHGDSDQESWTQLQRTARLQAGPLRLVLGGRLLLAFAGGVLIPFVLAVHALTPGWALVGAVFCLAGEVAERHLFFTSVAPDRMPGSA